MTSERQIKAFIERIIRLKDEQDAIGEDIKAVYAEAKSMGFDKTGLGDVVTHLRKIEKKGADTIAEKEAIFDIYLSAYQGSQAHAPARARENIEEFDPITGEFTIIDRTDTDGNRLKVTVDARVAAVLAKDTPSDVPASDAAVNSPETAEPEATVATQGEATAPTSIQSISPLGETYDGSSDANAGGDHVTDSRNAQNTSAVAELVKATAPPSLAEQRIANALILRPNCRRPAQETCGGAGRQHCRECATAPAEREREDA